MSNWKIYTGMKKLVLFTLILFSLSAMKIHSTELPREAKDIYLKKTQGNIQPPVVSLNELLSEPIAATIDGSLVEVYSQLSIESLTVTITNKLGQVVYSSSSYIDEITVLPISLTGNNSGEYNIEICYNDVVLIGKFYLE